MALIYGTTVSESIYGTAANDQIFADAGDDLIYGGGGVDSLWGEAGNDQFISTNGDLRGAFYGGSGTDTLRISSTVAGSTFAAYIGDGDSTENFILVETTQDMQIFANGYTDLSDFMSFQTDGADYLGIWGGSGNDSIAAFNLTQANARDTIYGGGGGDTIWAYAGNDIVFGDGGSDRIEGGLGDDTITGGSGADQFVFAFQLNNGTDTIIDFTNGTDKFNIRFTNGATFADLVITTEGADTRIAYDGTAGGAAVSTDILLTGVAAGTIDSSDFIFA